MAPSATPDVVAAAAVGEFDSVTEQPELVIIGGRVLLEPDDSRHTAARRRPGWGRQAILRVLALSPRPLQQSELAATVGISQQAVSLGLHRIPAEVARDVQGGSHSKVRSMLGWTAMPVPEGLSATGTGWTARRLRRRQHCSYWTN